MLEIILLILKIIGIIALSLVGLLILILLFVLFVPIRYQINSTNEVDGNIEVRGRISWLLHMIHVRIEYKKELSYYVRLFGIKVYPPKEKKEDTKKEDKKPENKKSEEIEKGNDSIEKTKVQISNPVEEEKKVTEKKESQIHSRERDISNYKEKKKNNSEAKDSHDKKKFTFKGLYDRIKETFLKIRKNIDFITDDSTKRAIKLCKDEILHIIKLIFPKKIRGVLKLGLENPALTGEIYGAYCTMFPIHKGDIVMVPYFDEEILEYRVMAKGYIQVITLLIIAIKIYFNKDIQRLIKIFQKEEE